MVMLDIRQREGPPLFRREAELPEGNCFTRLLAARVIASVHREPAEQVVARMWPRDRIIAELVERAATAPAMTTVTGWAAELAVRVVADTLQALGPVSAAAQLAQLGLAIYLDQRATIVVPSLVADATYASFVAEGDVIPVRQLVTTGPTLSPTQIATIAVLTREMIESSNAEALIADTLVRSAGQALDAALFDANPATGARPAGIRNGISTSTASNNTVFGEAFLEDLSTLIGVVGAVGGTGPYALIAGVGRAIGMGLRVEMQESNALKVLITPAAGNLLIAVAAPALALAISPDPQVETSKAASLHMDTAPQPMGTAGTARSLWQTDSIAIKVRWPVSWALRDPRGVAWMTPSWK